MPDERIRVLVADDHAVVRQGLKLFLDLQPDLEVVGEAEDGAEAVEKTVDLRPDLVVMDLVMPGTDGVDATRLLRSSAPETKVLVLTSFADDDQVTAVLRAGADGYLMKDVPPEEIADGVRAVYRGEPLLHPQATRALIRALAETRRPPEGTVTLLFTDIEASTQLFELLGDERARVVFREHDALLRDALERHGGAEVKHQGDGVMAAFSSARRALRCAVEIQEALVERNDAHPDTPLRVRIGMNTGEVIAENDDYFGACVVLAARIAEVACGGEILVSEVTKSLCGQDRMGFVERGEFTLKGLAGTHRLYEVRWTESGCS